VTLFTVMNENESWLLPRNVHDFTQLRGPRASPDELEHDDEFAESNLMHSINGYVYGTLPGLDMKRGEHVRWYVLDLGTEVDLHTPHWHGNTVTVNGMRSDMVQVLPGMMTVADMTPDDRGTWLFHCHVNDHIKAGMLALYHVS
jgi:manganese oxidase